MSCTPSNQTNYNTGTASCAGHRAASTPSTSVSLSSSFGVTGQKIYASDINALRTAINSELAYWNTWNSDNGQGAFTIADPGTISTGEAINHAHINDLNTSLAGVVNYEGNFNYGVTSSYGITNNGQNVNPGVSTGTGTKITASAWNSILASYNTLRNDCICNSDCHCNNVCTCYGDCGCNYSSDERVKENVDLLGKRNGLNIYSWNYIWDKASRHTGVMAQELLGTEFESAVKTDKDGFYSVDYSKLPI